LNTQNHLFFQNHSIHTDSIQRKNNVISENRYPKEISDSERSTPAKTINSSLKTKQDKAEKLTITEEKSIKNKGQTKSTSKRYHKRDFPKSDYCEKNH
jgi:hypothetical protein